MGTHVYIEHADSNPDLVTVNHVNPSDIPCAQTGRTSGGAWTTLGDPFQLAEVGIWLCEVSAHSGWERLFPHVTATPFGFNRSCSDNPFG